MTDWLLIILSPRMAPTDSRDFRGNLFPPPMEPRGGSWAPLKSLTKAPEISIVMGIHLWMGRDLPEVLFGVWCQQPEITTDRRRTCVRCWWGRDGTRLLGTLFPVTALSQGQTGSWHIPSYQGTAPGLLKPSVQLLGSDGEIPLIFFHFSDPVCNRETQSLLQKEFGTAVETWIPTVSCSWISLIEARAKRTINEMAKQIFPDSFSIHHPRHAGKGENIENIVQNDQFLHERL